MNSVPDSHGDLVLLAPAHASIPARFTNVEYNPARYRKLLTGVQKLRGRVYLEDGAVSISQLTPEGRHQLEADKLAWHLVIVNSQSEVRGCARYAAYSTAISNFRLSNFAPGVHQSALARSFEWGQALHQAVKANAEAAARRGVDIVEVGGWALSPELRYTAEGLRIALGTYSLARLLGGCIGLTTATRRHCSSSILRRIGGKPLVWNGVEMPRYFDPQYDCEMEILGFDSDRPNPRFEQWIDQLTLYLASTPVIHAAVYSASITRQSEMHVCREDMLAGRRQSCAVE